MPPLCPGFGHQSTEALSGNYFRFSSMKATAARTVTMEVIARWDVDNNSSLVIRGNERCQFVHDLDECCVRTTFGLIRFNEKFLATNQMVR